MRGGAEDDWSMPTYTTGGGFNSPTTMECVARADTSFACSCRDANTANCVSVGGCKYYGY